MVKNPLPPQPSDRGAGARHRGRQSVIHQQLRRRVSVKGPLAVRAFVEDSVVEKIRGNLIEELRGGGRGGEGKLRHYNEV